MGFRAATCIKACALAGACVVMLGLSGCFGGGGSSGAPTQTILQSDITLPSSVQVVSAN